MLELREAVNPPLEGLADRETLPENPLTLDMVRSKVALDPWFKLRLVGPTVIVKSGPLTSTVVD